MGVACIGYSYRVHKVVVGIGMVKPSGGRGIDLGI